MPLDLGIVYHEKLPRANQTAVSNIRYRIDGEPHESTATRAGEDDMVIIQPPIPPVTIVDGQSVTSGLTDDLSALPSSPSTPQGSTTNDIMIDIESPSSSILDATNHQSRNTV